jgi:hypothetical protein
MNARQARQRRHQWYYSPCAPFENSSEPDHRAKDSTNNLNQNSTINSVAPTPPEPTPPITEPEATASAPATQSDPLRCLFSFSDGRQCRMPKDERHPDFCLYHANKEEELHGLLHHKEPSAAAEIVPPCGEFTTATEVNRSLCHVFRLLAEGRISRRDAVAFGYLGQLMLQSVPSVRAEYVAAFGYRAWQENLTIRLGSSGSAANQQDALSPLNKVNKSEGSLREREIPAEPAATPRPAADPVAAPANPGLAGTAPDQKISTAPPAVSASVTPTPDFEGLLSRSLDAFDGKFDTTPEGRREMHRLMFDLEELAPTAMPRGSIEARLSATVRHIRERQSNESGDEAAPPYHN